MVVCLPLAFNYSVDLFDFVHYHRKTKLGLVVNSKVRGRLWEGFHILAWDIACRLFSHVFISCSIIMVAVSTAPAGSQALLWGLIILPLHSPLKQKAKATGGLTLPELCSESFS